MNDLRRPIPLAEKPQPIDMHQAAADLVQILRLCDRENLEHLRRTYVKASALQNGS